MLNSLIVNRREALIITGAVSVSLLAGNAAGTFAIADEATDIPVELELKDVAIDTDSSMATVSVWANNSGEKDYVCVNAKIRLIDDDGFVSQTEESSFVGWLPAGGSSMLEAELPMPEGFQTVDVGNVVGAQEGECVEFRDEGLEFVVLSSEGDEAGVLADILVLSKYSINPTYSEVSLVVKAFDADGFTLGECEVSVVDNATGPLSSGDSLRTNIIIPIEGAVSFTIAGIASGETVDPRDYGRASHFEIVEFGNYPQATDNPTPIEWLVLDEKGSRKLLLAKYALDCKPYNDEHEDTTWKTCTLRTWLNSGFLERAFTKEEQGRLAEVRLVNEERLANGDGLEYVIEGGSETYDRIFLLGFASIVEYANAIGPDIINDLICYPTNHAMKEGAYMHNENGGCNWWLRSPDESIPLGVLYVGFDGSPSSTFADSNSVAVRPALWVSDL